MRVFSVGVLVWLAAVLSAHALLSPDWYLQRGRVSHALTGTQREKAHSIANATDITVDYADFRSAVDSQCPPECPALAFRFYAAMAQAERREQILEAFHDRIELLQDAQSPLEEYIGRCETVLREDNQSSRKVEFNPRRLDMPDPDVDNIGLTIFRRLPWPEGLPRSDVSQLLAMAQDDRKLLDEMQKKALKAREDYRQKQLAWYGWLREMSLEVERRSESQLKAGKVGANP